MTRWCANVTLLYHEFPLLERFARAREDGFEAVEFWWPRGEDLAALAKAIRSSAIRVALMNIESGDMAVGERGFLNVPERRNEVLEAVRVAIDFAREVGCRRLNAPVGLDTGAPRAEQLLCAAESLRQAAALAKPHGILLHVEALNDQDNPRFLLHSTDAAIQLVEAAGGGVAILFDAYHMGRMQEDLVARARELGARLGHVQVADAPGRHEPGSGTLPIREFLAALDAAGYPGEVALEYLPLGSTRGSLKRLRAHGFLVGKSVRS